MQVVSLSAAGSFEYVEITGPDAIDFLQGQVTCDMQRLTAEQSLQGAICNIKGRVVADFRLLLLSEDNILLQTSAGMAQKIADTLGRYAVFSKVTITVTAGPHAVYGVIGQASSRALNEQFPSLPEAANAVLQTSDSVVIREPGSESRFQIWCHQPEAENKLLQLDAMEETAEPSIWTLQDIRSGQVHVTPATSEEYTPQLLNYDLSGVIDFEKGCYTGQEVVARMYYRGKAKKRLYRLRSEEAMAMGNFPDADILSVAATPEAGSEGLGIVKTDLAGSTTELDLESGKVELRVEEITYGASGAN
ncbi:MAG: hypothetical protein MI746_18405 [Pseudomonadales bacterium]|nr:hypothetical protein [Pseudomonadales bacterium]